MEKNNPSTSYPFLHEEKGKMSLHFGLQTIQSRMDKTDPDKLVLEYTRFMMGFLLFNPKPRKIVMIGLGGGSLAKYCRKNLPESRFLVVEISPEVIALKDTFLIPDEDEHFQIIEDDGADYVQKMPSVYGQTDVLLIDGFDERGQPKQLCSEEFYQHCYQALSPGGVMVVNLCVADSGCRSSIARIKDAFNGKALVINAEDGTNNIVFAGKNAEFPPSIELFSERLSKLESLHPVGLDIVVQKILGQNTLKNPTKKRKWW